MTAPTTTDGVRAAEFQASLVASGMPAEVAAELERRTEIVEHDEANDPSRAPMSPRELIGYVLVSAVAVAIGVLVVAL